MNNIELLKNHAINILNQYASYYGEKNARNIGGNLVDDSLFVSYNNDKYESIANKVVTYLCAYMNIDKKEITDNDYMNIKGILMIKNNIESFNGNDINPDYLYDYSKSMFCECHNVSYNEILDSSLAKEFDKAYIDSLLNLEFKKYEKLNEEFNELKNKKDKSFEDVSRLENLENIFLNLHSQVKSKFDKIIATLSLKEKNFDQSLASNSYFNLCFYRELMRLYNPINNDKDWMATIKNYIKENDEYNEEKLESIKIEVGNYYVNSIISSDSNKIINQNYPKLVSLLDDDFKSKEFFDNYFNFFEIGYRKYEDASKKEIPSL